MDYTSNAGRRYLKRFIPAMIAYAVLLSASLYGVVQLKPTGPLLWLLGIAPALPVIAVIAIMGLYLAEETDELLRRILVEAMLWGMGVTCAVCTIWGFLENVDALGHFPLYLVFPMFCGSFGLAQPFVRRRYQ